MVESMEEMVGRNRAKRFSRSYPLDADTGAAEMTETEYIIHSHRIKTSIAKQILSDILPDQDGVISEDEFRYVMRILAKWEDRLFKKIKTVEDGG